MSHHGKEPVEPSLDSVREQLVRLLESGAHEAAVELVLGLLESMVAENSKLAVRLHGVLRQLYRKKSERISPEQLSLFSSVLKQEMAAAAAVPEESEESAAEPSAAASNADADAGASSTSAVPRNRAKKRPFPETLRREVRLIPVSENGQTPRCADCGNEKSPMGVEVRETWEFKPAEFFIIEERLQKCVCRRCESGVVTAIGSTKPIPRGRPGPGLLAQQSAPRHQRPRRHRICYRPACVCDRAAFG